MRGVSFSGPQKSWGGSRIACATFDCSLGDQMPLESEITRIEGGIVIVALTGRLTLGSRLSLLDAEVTKLANDGNLKVILDLEHIEYADSSALGVLLHASGVVRDKGGELLLAAPNQRLKDLFALTNTSQLLISYPDRAACIAHLL
jgi:anti-sigma B factor antagonist